jgi:hypothetical protein
LKSGTFHGLPTYILSNAYLTIEFLQNAGPRIVRLGPAGSEHNLFAELPHKQLPSPHGPYTLYGGHRLWHAPETQARTYVPDDEGLRVEEIENGARMRLKADPHSHITKTIELRLDPEQAAATVQHTLFNEGLWPVQLAAWGITQLAPGGVAILPQTTFPLDESALLPNRQLILWPYTKWQDKRLELHDDYILVRSQPGNEARFKIGYLNRSRSPDSAAWAGHLGQGVFFCKRYRSQPEQPYPDMGCNTEAFTDEGSLELETLSPLTELAPGGSLTHTERWEIYDAEGVKPQIEAIREFIGSLELDEG